MTSEELKTTEIYPFSDGYPHGTGREMDDTLPDVPAMEQLPDPNALPDPGYPEMPASARDYASGPPAPPRPSFQPVAPRSSPVAAQSPLAAETPGPVWSPDPYAAPRTPDDAPPLRGPSVPWSQVRAAADHEATGEPPLLHPALPEEFAGRPTSDVLTSDLLLPGKRATPDGGWRRTVFRATGGLVHIDESSARLRRRDLVSRVRTPVARGHHRVAVLSLKGGVGKTTVTVGLGATLASLRGDRVIAVDANPDRGTLSDKVRPQTPATIRDLLNERAMIGRYADVRALTSQAPSRLEILASDRDPGVSVAFSADDYRAVAGVLEHYYSVCITDCGTGLLHSAMTGVLELADQIVLVSSPAVDGARSASATLDWLEAHGYGDLVRGGVVVLSAIRRKSKSTVDLDRLDQHFAARCRAVVRIPYDPHLEEGAEVELDFLNAETAEAYLTLAALVADAFAHPRGSAANAAAGFPLA
ncbi:MAG: AAA family ATPase [Trebonia sp.]